MSRPATGYTFFENGRWHVRYSLPDGTRPVEKLPEFLKPTDREQAVKIGAEVARQARVKFLPSSTPITFNIWLDRWIADRESRGLTSTTEHKNTLLKYVSPTIGALAMGTITREHIYAIVGILDERVRSGEIAWRTAQAIWSLVTTAFSDAVSSKNRQLVVLGSNPCVDVRGPDTGQARAKQWLTPAEFVQFVTSPAVPLRWKQIVSIAIYTYMRAAELAGLGVDDVRLDGGYILVHQTVERNSTRGKLGSVKTPKSGKSRRVPIEPAILPLFEQLVKAARSAGRRRLFTVPSASGAARSFRHYLKKAGVTRPDLHVTTALTKAITFHDLRATGITWMALRGDDPLKIMARAGHADFATTQIYVRAVEDVTSKVAPFPTLPPEVSSVDVLPDVEEAVIQSTDELTVANAWHGNTPGNIGNFRVGG